jgi:hypothetical protein
MCDVWGRGWAGTARGSRKAKEVKGKKLFQKQRRKTRGTERT